MINFVFEVLCKFKRVVLTPRSHFHLFCKRVVLTPRKVVLTPRVVLTPHKVVSTPRVVLTPQRDENDYSWSLATLPKGYTNSSKGYFRDMM